MPTTIKYDFKENAFFALARRVRFIKRWSLMHNLVTENVSEHSHEVAIFAHGISLIGKTKFNKKYCPNKICTIATYHENAEAACGDLASTLKHANTETSRFFGDLESVIERDMIDTLPEYMRDEMSKVASHDSLSVEEKDIVKAADLMSMLLKCDREITLGNTEFTSAQQKIEIKFREYMSKYPEVAEFYDTHLAQCKQTIDKLVNL